MDVVTSADEVGEVIFINGFKDPEYELQDRLCAGYTRPSCEVCLSYTHKPIIAKVYDAKNLYIQGDSRSLYT